VVLLKKSIGGKFIQISATVWELKPSMKTFLKKIKNHCETTFKRVKLLLNTKKGLYYQIKFKWLILIGVMKNIFLNIQAINISS
jgi:hypothetical protein